MHRDAPKRWFHNRWVHLVALLMLTGSALSVGLANVRPARDIAGQDLDRLHAPTRGYVRVTCDRVQNDDWRILEGDDVAEHITFCWLGKHMLPVVTKDDGDLTAAVVEGKLHFIEPATLSEKPWIDELHADPELDARSYEVYLVRDDGDHRIDFILGVMFLVGAAAGWYFWIRAFVRSRRAKRA